MLRGLYKNITGSTFISLGIILLLRTMLIRNLSGPYSWTVFLLLLSLIILKSTILVLTWFNWFCWLANRLDCWVTCEFTGWKKGTFKFQINHYALKTFLITNFGAVAVQKFWSNLTRTRYLGTVLTVPCMQKFATDCTQIFYFYFGPIFL